MLQRGEDEDGRRRGKEWSARWLRSVRWRRGREGEGEGGGDRHGVTDERIMKMNQEDDLTPGLPLRAKERETESALAGAGAYGELTQKTGALQMNGRARAEGGRPGTQAAAPRARGPRRCIVDLPALPTVRPRYAGSPGAGQERRSQRSECNVVGLSGGRSAPARRSPVGPARSARSALTGLDLALCVCVFLSPVKRREARRHHPLYTVCTSTQYRHSLRTPALPGNEIRPAIGASIPLLRVIPDFPTRPSSFTHD